MTVSGVGSRLASDILLRDTHSVNLVGVHYNNASFMVRYIWWWVRLVDEYLVISIRRSMTWSPRLMVGRCNYNHTSPSGGVTVEGKIPTHIRGITTSARRARGVLHSCVAIQRRRAERAISNVWATGVTRVTTSSGELRGRMCRYHFPTLINFTDHVRMIGVPLPLVVDGTICCSSVTWCCC